MKNDIVGEPTSAVKQNGTEPRESTAEGGLRAFDIITRGFNPYGTAQRELPIDGPGQLEFKAPAQA